MKKAAWRTVVMGLVLGVGGLSQAVIIDSATGTGNTTAPAGFSYWDSIGTAGGGTCVYLGDGYCLTAYHIKALDWDTGHYAPTVNLGGVNYNIDTSSWNRLKNGTTNADLLQFRLTSVPTVAAVPVASKIGSMQSTGTAVWMMGDGCNRASTKSYWSGSWNPGSPAGAFSGYAWDTSGHSTRWGTNQISRNNLQVDDGFGATQMYSAAFDTGVGDNECIAATGDSGGPVFTCTGGTWRLAGIDLAVDNYGGQPGNTSVYGNSSYFADLSAYTITPEPAMLSFFVLAAVAVWRRKP